MVTHSAEVHLTTDHKAWTYTTIHDGTRNPFGPEPRFKTAQRALTAARAAVVECQDLSALEEIRLNGKTVVS